MNDSAALERRYRRLLAAFPAAHRRQYKEEMIGVLLASAPEGRRRPALADAANLIASGLRTRLRLPRSGASATNWSDALAVTSVAIPVTLLSLLAVNYVWNVASGSGLAGSSDFYLPSVAPVLPALIALRYRRSAAILALVAAAWFCFLLLRLVTVWIDGLEASYCLALLVQAIALAYSPGPRRAAAIMTWKTWLVLCATWIIVGMVSIPFLWAPLAWQATGLAILVLAAAAGGLMLTLPRPVAVRLLLLLAIPAIPCAAWVVQFVSAGWSVAVPFPVFLALPLLMLACFGAVAAQRARRGRGTA